MSRSISLAEVSRHKSKADLWVVVHGKVIDASKYVEEHPGGVETLLEVAGTDATSTFEDVGHSEDAREEMEKLCVGSLEGHVEQDVAVSPKKAAMPTPEIITASSPGGSSMSSVSIPSMQNIAIPEWMYDAMAAIGVLAAGIALYHHLVGHRSSPLNDSTSRVDGFASHDASSGFWTGFVAAGVVGTLALAAAVMRLNQALSTTPSISSFPTHRKPAGPAAVLVHGSKGFLDPKLYQKLPLIRKDYISSNVIQFTFQLPSASAILGLPIGQHIAIRADIDGAQVSRSYTPVSNNTDKGVLRLVTKIYPDGQLTGKYLQKLRVGDRIELRGPKGTMRYRKGGFKQIGMIAGGTGITPMFQIIRAICEDPTDDATVSLIYANQSQDDILLREMLENWQKSNSGKFKLWYKLDKPPAGWKGGVGFVNADDIKQKLPPPGKETQIMLCGPPGMVKGSQKNLEALGYDKASAVSKPTDMVFCF